MNSTGQLEEKLNTYSHGLGIILALVGGILLLKEPVKNLELGLIIYSISLLLLFIASTIYHGVRNPNLKKKLRVLDHISIYYLIAGTYTPICLSILKDSKGILLLYLVWGIAILGTILKLFFTGKFETFSLILYGIMGWLVVIDYNYLIQNFSSEGLFYLALGGGFYTIGILFYAIKKIPFNHFIWHLFVLGGAISHWWCIYNFII
ncbi:hemolysin III family protein [Croceitalea sp. MTPC9]|uniref:PAQR family membrane homeostasis protein TrhA n=1 Tax=unclassified Croceitalea TaxID=2632280 RepID=UPI002B3C25FD|nr:hemolysin III family protein [Croceitalea sp. MTPC6]GMN16307.1 hemolysin III family protein [Croceitalea sp. MTPC9]